MIPNVKLSSEEYKMLMNDLLEHVGMLSAAIDACSRADELDVTDRFVTILNAHKTWKLLRGQSEFPSMSRGLCQQKKRNLEVR